MIGYLRGQLHQVMPEGILLETGGIGWLVRTATNRSWPEPGAEVAVYTQLVVREDALELYGFTRPEELRLFTLLRGVNGIGPRGALQILGAATPDQFARAIAAGDTAFLTALPGIGAKKAQRLLVELKDTVRKSRLINGPVAAASPAGDKDNDEVLAALEALGYSREEVAPVLARARQELGSGATTTALLQAVLKTLGQGGGF
ncbi:Holliday junction branch migration protein RuvA [Moorella naiadis]|uniref:Holliday junction branch migration protein RuvA n=1 Tax=Moorella naiadis (nom. illeg.) TaxID=3093670 RepID=UPI003D9C9DFA